MRVFEGIFVGSVVLAVFSGSTFGQGKLWVVDDDPAPGADFLEIQAAIDAAGDGDAILVKAGTYRPFAILNRSLAVVAELGAEVVVRDDTDDLCCLVRVRHWLPGPYQVLIQGLTLSRSPGPGGAGNHGKGMHVSAGANSTWIEDCRIEGRGGTAALTVVDSSSVVVVRCELEGFPYPELIYSVQARGLEIRDSDLTVYDSVVIGAGGGAGLSPGVSCENVFQGLDGAVMENSRLHAMGSIFVGGDGGESGDLCCGTLGAQTSKGASGIRVAGLGSELFSSNSEFVSGQPGTSNLPECSPGLISPAIDSPDSPVTFLPALPPRTRLTSPVRTDEDLIQAFYGAFASKLTVGYSIDPYTLPVPGVFGALQIGMPAQVFPLGNFFGFEAQVSAPLSSLQGLEFVVVYSQVGSQKVSGLLQLGSPSAVLILDEAF